MNHALTTAILRNLPRKRLLVHRAALCSPASHFPLHRRTFASQQEVVEDEGAASVVSKEDFHREEVIRQRLSDVLISEVLKTKHAYRWVSPVISNTATVQEAIETVIEGGLSAMMVLDQDNHVVGLLTSRDLLRILANDPNAMQRSIGEKDMVTPISQVIYARPDETIGMCRTLMAKLGIKCLPILSNGQQVEGLITARDMSDYGLSAKDKGGKSNYLADVSERVGLSSDTSMAEPPAFLKAHLALEQTPLCVNVGTAALPHPFKGKKRIPEEINNDPELSEDSYFVRSVELPDGKDKTLKPYTYVGVADGVGSWHEYGVDPRLFSRTLMAESDNILLEAARNGQRDSKAFRHVSAPAEVMAQAYERVKAEDIIGSSTACIALFDGRRHQLHFSNLGDSGLIILRHIDSNVAGSLKRERHVPRTERTSDLRLAFVSQQQLHSFNHPYQLGWTGEEIPEGSETSFKTARAACTTSIHVRRGDIILVATDGLFDNVEEEEICEIALKWEKKHGFIGAGDVEARDKRWSDGGSMAKLSSDVIGDLAKDLCDRARRNSLDSTKDSPFAILAKENDIMWSGGMPDDCTVVAVHVVGKETDSTQS